MPRHRTAEQWQDLVNQQEQGTLTVADFCRKKRLCPSSFHRWRRKFRPHKGEPSGFFELGPQLSAEAAAGTWTLDLELPGGGTLRLRWER